MIFWRKKLILFFVYVWMYVCKIKVEIRILEDLLTLKKHTYHWISLVNTFHLSTHMNIFWGMFFLSPKQEIKMVEIRTFCSNRLDHEIRRAPRHTMSNRFPTPHNLCRSYRLYEKKTYSKYTISNLVLRSTYLLFRDHIELLRWFSLDLD